MHPVAILTALIPACLACGGGDPGAAAAADTVEAEASPAALECEVIRSSTALPDEVRETSGLARSGRDQALLWTHNDAGNEPLIYAFDRSGRLVQRVRVVGADLTDWEDVEAAPCGDASCLYLADIGDNDSNRERVTIYRVAEPAAGASRTAPADALHARFPDGPKDAEALFAHGSGDLYVVNKGRREGIGLYRYAAPHRAGETGTLEHVRQLFPEPRNDADRVTAASATSDGRWVGIRTYRTLYLYRTDRLLGEDAVEATVVDLSSLGEAQGRASRWRTTAPSGCRARPGAMVSHLAGRASTASSRTTEAGPRSPVSAVHARTGQAGPVPGRAEIAYLSSGTRFATASPPMTHLVMEDLMAEVQVDGTTIELTVGDIAAQDGVDAVVNAANAELRIGGGVAGALHRAAGPGLEEETRPLAPIRPGEAVITSGHRLPNPYVIHSLGPVYGRDEPADELLASCYREALRLAEQNGLRSIAFPAISTGAFGYPMEAAARIALETVTTEARRLSAVGTIRFVLYDEAALDVHRRALEALGGKVDG